MRNSDIDHLKQMFERVVVVGKGRDAWFANQISHKYALRALLTEVTQPFKKALS